MKEKKAKKYSILFIAYCRAMDFLRSGWFRLRKGTRYRVSYYNDYLRQAISPGWQSDITDHLGVIFFFVLHSSPRLIVELGVRSGESTRVLLAAAEAANAHVLSIDIEPWYDIEVPFKNRWSFIQADDVDFGRNGFVSWCVANHHEPKVDVLFVDTSHEYEHTKQEILTWSNHLADGATLIFHDTNMGEGVYVRYDGSIGFGWDNDRGVIRAVEELVGKTYDENTYFTDATDKFLVMHFPGCNGLTVLRKKPEAGLMPTRTCDGS
jgi:cephalosporin hydroxylase